MASDDAVQQYNGAVVRTLSSIPCRNLSAWMNYYHDEFPNNLVRLKANM